MLKSLPERKLRALFVMGSIPLVEYRDAALFALVPYATLFRSSPLALIRLIAPTTTPDRLARAVQGASGLDRKSTRLNSSHRCISYAVFCLKNNGPCAARRAGNWRRPTPW